MSISKAKYTSLKETLNHYSTMHLNQKSINNSYRKRDLFHLGISKTIKEKAFNQFIDFMDGKNIFFDENSIRALRDGRLGNIIRTFAKTQNLTVRQLLSSSLFKEYHELSNGLQLLFPRNSSQSNTSSFINQPNSQLLIKLKLPMDTKLCTLGGGMNGIAYRYINSSGFDRVRKLYHSSFRLFTSFTGENIVTRVTRIWNEYYQATEYPSAFSPDNRILLDTPFISGQTVEIDEFKLKYKDIVDRNMKEKGLYMKDNGNANSVIIDSYPYPIDFDEVYHIKNDQSGSFASRLDSGDLYHLNPRSGF